MPDPSLRFNIDRIVAADGGITIEGWAAGLDGRPLSIEARCGAASATTLADIHRPDVQAAGVGDGHHGFFLTVPAVTPADAGRLHITTGGRSLPPSAGTFVDPAMLEAWPPLIRVEGGVASGLHHRHGLLRAWVRPIEGSDPELTVELDGRTIWRGEPRRRDAVFVQGELRSDGRAVRLLLPEPAQRREARELRVRLGGAELAGSPLRLSYPDQYRGNVEAVDRVGPDRFVARGWCVNQARPSSPTLIVVTNDGVPVGEGRTRGSRGDLLDAGVDAPDVFFRIPFTAEGGEPGVIEVRPALSNRPLAGDLGIRAETVEAAVEPAPARTATASRAISIIAFAVTEASPTTAAGDYFTAFELGRALAAREGVEVRYLQVETGGQYEVGDADVVIAMRDDYDPTQIRSGKPNLITVAWLRNWFDRFADRPWLHAFDQVWAASIRSGEALADRLGRDVRVLPIATDPERFRSGRPRPAWRGDYGFTGSYWGVSREIVRMLEPSGLPFDFALFGQGWEAVPSLAPYARGHVPYAELPDVYAGLRLVVDDANHVTRAWASVNSRVFDAIAAGALPVTNGEGGSAELFGGLLPTWRTPQELEALLWTYLADEPARLALVARLQAVVLAEHTYAHRAGQVWRWLDRARSISPASA